MTGTTRRVNTARARSVMPMFLVVSVYALYTYSTRSVHTAQRYCCCKLSVACLVRRVLDLVYAVWRLASWRSECIDDRAIDINGSDDWHMGRGAVYCIADFCGSSVAWLWLACTRYGLCEFYV